MLHDTSRSTRLEPTEMYITLWNKVNRLSLAVCARNRGSLERERERKGYSRSRSELVSYEKIAEQKSE